MEVIKGTNVNIKRETFFNTSHYYVYITLSPSVRLYIMLEILSHMKTKDLRFSDIIKSCLIYLVIR